MPNAESESEFQDILLRLITRLEEAEELEANSSFECLKETMSYYLKQDMRKGENANWIVRDFQQIDGDILKSSVQDSNLVYHFACVSDSDMNVKKEDLFPWPLNLEFFECAYEPLDWKYQAYIKSRREFKHFKRYAFIYGLEFNRCHFKISYVKNDDDKENEIYYLLKLIGVEVKENQHKPADVTKKPFLTFDLGLNENNFRNEDAFRRRICSYRFALETLIEGGSRYKDSFLQSKYFEIFLANRIRKKLENQIGTESVLNEALDDEIDEWKRYFRFLNESQLMDVKSNVKATLKSQVLKDKKYFPEVNSEDEEMMYKKEEFIYLRLKNEKKENVLNGKFKTLSYAEKRTFLPEQLKEEKYKQSVNIWCQWCADREICLEYYKSPVER